MSMPRNLLFLVVLLVIAGGAYWLLLEDAGLGDDHEPQERDATPISAPEGSEVQSESKAVAKVVTNPFDPKVEEPITADEADRFEQAEPDGKRLRVVHESTGQPVPGAIVIFASQFGMGSEDKMTRSFVSSRGFADFIMKRGRIFRCDEAGETRVPFDERVMAIFARKGGLMGTLSMRAAREPVLEIKVSKGQHITVRVEGPGGDPVPNVEVALRLSSDPSQIGFDLLKATSDAKGIAQLRHIQNPLTVMSMGREVPKCSVALALPMLKSPSVDINPKEIPTEPVVLKMPPARGCTVKVRTPDNQPPPVGTVVLITHPELWKSKSQPPTGAAVATCNQAGDASFINLPEMDQWNVVAWHESIPVDVEVVSDSAGASSLPEVIDLTWDPTFPSYRMRVLDHESNPMPGARISVSYARRMRDTEFFTLDEESRLTLQISKWEENQNKIGIKTLNAKVSQAANAELPEVLSGIHDLPDIRLAALPLLAEGVVLGPDSKPLGQAVVRAQWEADTPALRRKMYKAIGYTTYQTITDDEGRFAFQGPHIPEASLKLIAQHGLYEKSALDDVRAGTEGVVLTLAQVGSLSATLVVPNWCDVEKDLVIELHQGDAVLRNSFVDEPLKIEVENGIAKLDWRRVPLGSWDLSIYADAQRGESLFQSARLSSTNPKHEKLSPLGVLIRGIRIEGGPNEDSRLQNIDLSPYLRPIDIIVTEPKLDDGHKISLVVKQPVGTITYRGQIKDGQYRVVLPRAGQSGTIKVDGHEPLETQLIGKDIHVRLRSISTYVFEFTNVPEGTQRIAANLALETLPGKGGRRSYIYAEKPSTGKPWRSLAQSMQPGTYKATVYLVMPSQSGKSTTATPVDLPQPIQVIATSEKKTMIVVSLP